MGLERPGKRRREEKRHHARPEKKKKLERTVKRVRDIGWRKDSQCADRRE